MALKQNALKEIFKLILNKIRHGIILYYINKMEKRKFSSKTIYMNYSRKRAFFELIYAMLSVKMLLVFAYSDNPWAYHAYSQADGIFHELIIVADNDHEKFPFFLHPVLHVQVK